MAAAAGHAMEESAEPTSERLDQIAWQDQQDPLYVFFNPVAGNHDSEQVERALRSVLDRQRFPYQLHRTEAREDLHVQARAARQSGFRRFLVAGGDGSVSGVASGLVGSGLPLAIAPTGTANALAQLLGIPLELDRAVRWWLPARRCKAVDAMQVAERYYFLNISLGLSSRALQDVKNEDKERLGSLVYIWKGLQRLAGISPFLFRMVIDGKSFTRRAAELVVANTGIQQFHPIRLDPEIHMDDGVLSVCHLRARHLGDYVRIAANAVLGRTPQAYGVTCRQARQTILINSQQRLPIQADGELIEHTPITIEVCPQAAHFLTPL